jgi:hypothetical protein
MIVVGSTLSQTPPDAFQCTKPAETCRMRLVPNVNPQTVLQAIFQSVRRLGHGHHAITERLTVNISPSVTSPGLAAAYLVKE